MPIPSKTVWQVLDSRTAGGIESHVLELASGLRAWNWDVQVIFLNDYGPHPLKEALSAAGVSWWALDGSITGLYRNLSSHLPAIIHTHGYKAGILCRPLGKMLGARVVSTFHAGERPAGKLALYDALDRYTAPLAACLSVSEAIAARLPARSRVLDNFVTLPDQVDSLEVAARKDVGFVGRLSPEKGPDLFCKLARRFPGTRFHLFGEGPLGAEIEKAAPENLVLQGRVDMARHWQEIGLLCMPSRFEGLPMAALEAMARGIPVLASQVGALPTLLTNEEDGWTVPMGDLEAFVARLDQWQDMSSAHRLALSLNARQTIARRYSPQAVLPKIEEIYAAA